MKESKYAEKVVIKPAEKGLDEEEVKKKLKNNEEILPVNTPGEFEISLGVKTVELMIKEKSPDDAVAINDDTNIELDNGTMSEVGEGDTKILENESIFPKGLQTVRGVVRKKLGESEFILPFPVLLKRDHSSTLNLFFDDLERAAQKHGYKVIKKHATDLLGKERGSIRENVIELISDLEDREKSLAIISDVDLLTRKKKKSEFARKEFLQGLTRLANLIGERNEFILIMTSDKILLDQWIEELSLIVEIERPNQENLMAATDYLGEVYGEIDEDKKERIKEKIGNRKINTYSALKKEYMIQGWECAGIDASVFEDDNLSKEGGKRLLYH